MNKAWSPKIWAMAQHNQVNMASTQEEVEMGSTPLARNQIQIKAKDINGVESKASPSRKRQMTQQT
jgi:hypothetical protein